jgi:hypothetical protein
MSPAELGCWQSFAQCSREAAPGEDRQNDTEGLMSTRGIAFDSDELDSAISEIDDQDVKRALRALIYQRRDVVRQRLSGDLLASPGSM